MAWLIAALLVTVSLIYWQTIKKKLVRNQIENLVSNKSDSAYFIHYDSSSIDEVAGNASFYNISLQPDKDSAKSERTDRFNITVKSVKVTGVDIPGLISGNRVKAGSITDRQPGYLPYSASLAKRKTGLLLMTLQRFIKNCWETLIPSMHPASVL
ncbi:MAG: hypothetical protein V9E88_01825 [Ferruginibacter sp.]